MNQQNDFSQGQNVQSNSIIFAGPFMGEFGWELSHWIPHVRWLRNKYKGRRLIVSSYPGRHSLYYNVADDFIELPKWFVEKKYDCDCFEALSTNGHYEKLMLHFVHVFENVKNLLWTKTPRGFNKILRESNKVVFDKLAFSSDANKEANELINKFGGKPIIIMFARSMSRDMFLDITYNANAFVEDYYPDGLPTRNWPRSHWEDLFEMLYEKYSNDFTFVIGGTKGGNCLIEKAEKYKKNVIDLTEIDIKKSLDITVALLNKAFLSISSQSGPTHLSLHCGCPSFIYGDEMKRHSHDDNPLKTDVVFFETRSGFYNDDPKLLFKELSVYIHQLSVEKGLKPSSVEVEKKASTKIKKIGFVGVFDNPNSTNIPFAKAFANKGYQVSTFNYRTVAAEIGIPGMNKEIEKFAPNVDLIVFCKGNGIRSETIEACSKITRTCFYMMDAKIHLDQDPHFYKMAEKSTFSVVTTNEVKCALIGQQVKNVNHIIQGIDTNIFKPIDGIEKSLDVVFIGQSTPKRDAIIKSIEDDGIDIVAYGPRYGRECYQDEFSKVCSTAKILLAINNTDSDQDSFSDRILRYMACRGCVITEYSKGLEKYFDNGFHCAWPIKGDLANMIRFYLEHSKMRDQMAERGYKYVTENFTWDKVADQIIEIAEAI